MVPEDPAVNHRAVIKCRRGIRAVVTASVVAQRLLKTVLQIVSRFYSQGSLPTRRPAVAARAFFGGSMGISTFGVKRVG